MPAQAFDGLFEGGHPLARGPLVCLDVVEDSLGDGEGRPVDGDAWMEPAEQRQGLFVGCLHLIGMLERYAVRFGSIAHARRAVHLLGASGAEKLNLVGLALAVPACSRPGTWKVAARRRPSLFLVAGMDVMPFIPGTGEGASRGAPSTEPAELPGISEAGTHASE